MKVHYVSVAVKLVSWLFVDICGSDPSHVIGLYPNLLPEDFRKQLDYPDALPDLDGTELERGILSLIDYLTQVVRLTETWQIIQAT